MNDSVVDVNFKDNTLRLLNKFHNELKDMEGQLPRYEVTRQMNMLYEKFCRISKAAFEKITEQILRNEDIEVPHGSASLGEKLRTLIQEIEEQYSYLQQQHDFTLQDSFVLGDFSHRVKQKVLEYRSKMQLFQRYRVANVRLDDGAISKLVRQLIVVNIDRRNLDDCCVPYTEYQPRIIVKSGSVPNMLNISEVSTRNSPLRGVNASNYENAKHNNYSRLPIQIPQEPINSIGRISSFKRFKSFDETKEWNTDNWDAIKFVTKRPIRLVGFGSFRHKYDKMGGLLYRVIVNRREVIKTKEVTLWKNIPDKHVTQILFDEAIEILAGGEFHIVTMHENAKMDLVRNACFCGKFGVSKGGAHRSNFILVENSQYDENGTTISVGQIPEIYFQEI